MQLLQKNRCFEGEQRIYQIDSQHLKGLSKVGVYLPPAALEGKPCSALFYSKFSLYTTKKDNSLK